MLPQAEGAPSIGTHSGSFHCDEALACAMLKMLPEFAGHGKCICFAYVSCQ